MEMHTYFGKHRVIPSAETPPMRHYTGKRRVDGQNTSHNSSHNSSSDSLVSSKSTSKKAKKSSSSASGQPPGPMPMNQPLCDAQKISNKLKEEIEKLGYVFGHTICIQGAGARSDEHVRYMVAMEDAFQSAPALLLKGYDRYALETKVRI